MPFENLDTAPIQREKLSHVLVSSKDCLLGNGEWFKHMKY